jgi:hypothetical protein
MMGVGLKVVMVGSGRTGGNRLQIVIVKRRGTKSQVATNRIFEPQEVCPSKDESCEPLMQPRTSKVESEIAAVKLRQ